jgi:hypothetical protein
MFGHSYFGAGYFGGGYFGGSAGTVTPPSPPVFDWPIFAIGALPIAALDQPVAADAEDLLRLDQGPVIDLVYLLELMPFSPAAASVSDTPLAAIKAIGSLPIAAIDEPTGISAPVPFYFSDIGWTAAPDDPDAPNRHYAPRIAQGGTLRLDRSIPITPDAQRRVLLQLGDITLVNGDRALDDLVRRMAIDGRLVKLLCGRPGGRYADFVTVFIGTASSWKLAGDGSIALTLRDASWQLDAPAQRNLYAGTGMAGGGLDVKNKPKPLCYGECLNVPLAYIDTTNRVFQVHDGPIEAVIAVYDAELALTAGIDVDDIWAAAPPAAGTYITQKSGGYIRLGDKPQGTITADVRGDKAFGSYVSTAGGIAFRIAHDRGGIADDKFDLTSFELLNNVQPAPVGIYTGLSTFTIADLWDSVLGSINAWYGANAQDKIQVGRLDLPRDTAAARLTTKDITALTLQDTPSNINPPVYKVSIGYQRNWTPSPSSIAGAVTDDRLAFLANEYRYGNFEDIDLLVPHLRAQEMTLPGLFANEADADAEAERLQQLYGGPFQQAQLVTKLQGYLIQPDFTINTDYPRYGLDGGRNVIVTGQGIDGSRNEATIQFLY